MVNFQTIHNTVSSLKRYFHSHLRKAAGYSVLSGAIALLLMLFCFHNITYSQKLWGATAQGGTSNKGVIFQYDMASSIITNKNNRNLTDGYFPNSTLLRASNGRLYGTAYFGGINSSGVLFEYKISTETYTVKVNFGGELGVCPVAPLIQANNGKFYGTTIVGGASDLGVLFEYDPVTETYNKLVDFDSTLGANPKGALFQASDGKLYGTTTGGGANGLGTLFRYTISNGLYENVYHFSSGLNSCNYGSFIEPVFGKLYGLSLVGGANSLGAVFEYDIATSAVTIKAEFSLEFFRPVGTITKAQNGKFYGMTEAGGVNNIGVIFEYSFETSALTKVYDFSPVDGANPQGSFMQASDGKLYGVAYIGGENGRGTVFTLDPSTNSFTKKADFDGDNGSGPYAITLIEVPDNPVINVSITGNGTVSKNADQSSYELGDQVQVTATPASGWVFTGWTGDTTSSNNPITLTVNGNENITAVFQPDSNGLRRFRSFHPDSIFLDVDNKGVRGKAVKAHADKVQFAFSIVPDSNNINGLHLEFGSDVDTSLGFIVTPTPVSKISLTKSSSKKWNLKFASKFGSTQTIVVSGWAERGGLQKVSSYWWMRDSIIIGKKLKNPAFTINKPGLPLPNRINVLEAVYKLGKKTTLFLFIIGIERKDSAQKYAWVQLNTYNNFYNSIAVVTKNGINYHDGSPRGFDKFLTGQQISGKNTSLPPIKQDNVLFANMLAMKLSIYASMLGVTPAGFGELVYNDTAISPFNGLMLKQIVKKADSMLTGYSGHHFDDSATFAKLNWTLRRVLDAFEGPIDTVKFYDTLKIKGPYTLADRVFLKWNTGTVPATILFNDEISSETPSLFALQQNYPNPFNPTTTIEFELAEPSFVTLKVYNMLGQEVATLLSGEQMEAGGRMVEFNASDYASGIYFYRLSAQGIEGSSGSFTGEKKMILIK